MIPVADTGFAEASWILVVKSLVIFLVAFMVLPLLTVLERKLIGRFQNRYGPNRVGPFGILQPLADVGKLLGKESFRPQNAVATLFVLGPALVVLSAVLWVKWADNRREAARLQRELTRVYREAEDLRMQAALGQERIARQERELRVLRAESQVRQADDKKGGRTAPRR